MGKVNTQNYLRDKNNKINQPTYELDKNQIDLLNLDLKFCPTPKSNLGKLKKKP